MYTEVEPPTMKEILSNIAEEREIDLEDLIDLCTTGSSWARSYFNKSGYLTDSGLANTSRALDIPIQPLIYMKDCRARYERDRKFDPEFSTRYYVHS